MINLRRVIVARQLSTAAEEAQSSHHTSVAAAAAEPPPPSPPRLERENRVYRRLSSIGKSGKSVSRVINEYTMEGRVLSKDELVRCAKELRKYRNYQHALQVMEWLEMRNVNFSYTDYAIYLDLVSKTKGIAAAERYFDCLPVNARNKWTYGTLLNCYCKELAEDNALALFEKMDLLNYTDNSLAFDNLITMYMKMHKPEKVPPLVQEMKRRNHPLSTSTFNIWMQSYADMNDIEAVERVLEELANGNEDKCDWTTYSNLANIYVKAGQFEKAKLALKKAEQEMKPGNREAYHFLISLYASISNLSEVYRVWNSLKARFSITINNSYLVMLHALRKMNDIEGLKICYSEWLSRCPSFDLRLVNVAIDAYLKNDLYNEAAAVFDDATKRTKGPFFNAREMFMVFFLKEYCVDLAWSHMEAAVSELKDFEWKPSPKFVTAFLKYFEVKKDADGAEQFCRILKKLNCLDADAYHLLLKTYIAAGKICPQMHGRLEEDKIEISNELETLLKEVCPE